MTEETQNWGEVRCLECLKDEDFIALLLARMKCSMSMINRRHLSGITTICFKL
jgi:hypothetical protein